MAALGNSVAQFASDMICSATSISPVPTRDVCVVIPAFNDEALIGRCIQSALDAGLLPGQTGGRGCSTIGRLTLSLGFPVFPSNPFAVHHSTTIQGAKR